MLVPALIAVGLIAACSIGFIRRNGSTGPMRLCFFTIGLMALTQGATMLAPVWEAPAVVTQLLQLLLAGLTLHVLYLLAIDRYDNNSFRKPRTYSELAVASNVSKSKNESNENRTLVDTP